MYIEFQLPTLPSGANQILVQALHAWSDRYGIPYNLYGIPYNTKIHKHVRRITFDHDTSYSLFAMTWRVDHKYRFLARWRIVSDLNNKSSFDCVL